MNMNQNGTTQGGMTLAFSISVLIVLPWGGYRQDQKQLLGTGLG
jgi:hypothetical protein